MERRRSGRLNLNNNKNKKTRGERLKLFIAEHEVENARVDAKVEPLIWLRSKRREALVLQHFFVDNVSSGKGVTVSIDVKDAVEDKDAEVVDGTCARNGDVELPVGKAVILEVDTDATQRLSRRLVD